MCICYIYTLSNKPLALKDDVYKVAHFVTLSFSVTF